MLTLKTLGLVVNKNNSMKSSWIRDVDGGTNSRTFFNLAKSSGEYSKYLGELRE